MHHLVEKVAFMDIPLERWVSELENDEYFVDQFPNHCQVFDEYVQLLSIPEDNSKPSSSVYVPKSDQKCISNATTTTTTTISGRGLPVEVCRTRFEMATKQLKTSIASTIATDQNMGNPKIINCQVQAPPPNHAVSGLKIIAFDNMNIKPDSNMEDGTVCTRTPSRAKEHILAERKRRERLTQLFIAFSSLIPGLKKRDKASILGDAIMYIKHLEDRKNILEKECANITQSVAFMRKSVISQNEEGSVESLPEIEVKSSNSALLIRIHCERRNGVMAKITSEMEKLNLTMVNTVSMSFGDSNLDITIIAQIDSEFNLTANDLGQKLRSAILNM